MFKKDAQLSPSMRHYVSRAAFREAGLEEGSGQPNVASSTVSKPRPILTVCLREVTDRLLSVSDPQVLGDPRLYEHRGFLVQAMLYEPYPKDFSCSIDPEQMFLTLGSAIESLLYGYRMPSERRSRGTPIDGPLKGSDPEDIERLVDCIPKIARAVCPDQFAGRVIDYYNKFRG